MHSTSREIVSLTVYVNNTQFVALCMSFYGFTGCLVLTCVLHIGKEVLAGISGTCDTTANTQCGDCGKLKGSLHLASMQHLYDDISVHLMSLRTCHV